jgi:hypothetical protein
MTAVDKETKKLMVETEIHGLDVELDIKRHQHQVLTTEIEQLEQERADLTALLE